MTNPETGAARRGNPRPRAADYIEFLARLCAEYDYDKAAKGLSVTPLDVLRRADRDPKFAADLTRAERLEALRIKAALVRRVKRGEKKTIALGSGKSAETIDHDPKLAALVLDMLSPKPSATGEPSGDAIRVAETRGYIAAFDDIKKSRPAKADQPRIPEGAADGEATETGSGDHLPQGRARLDEDGRAGADTDRSHSKPRNGGECHRAEALATP